MTIETIAFGNAAKDDKKLTVTMSGEPDGIVEALVNGLPKEALEQIRDAIGEELERRKTAPPAEV